MDIGAIDTSKMIFDPKERGFIKTVKEKVPGIVKRNFHTLKDSNVLKYIALMYDYNSPLVQEIDDWWMRKMEAAEAAGFKIIEERDEASGSLINKFEIATEKMLMGRYSSVNNAIIDFLGYLKKPRWNQLVYYYETLLTYTEEALGGKQGSSSDINAVGKLLENIDKATHAFLGTMIEEETARFKERLYSRIEQSRLAIRPEDYAERLGNGDNLDADSPYGRGYAVKRIKFVGDTKPDE